MATIKVKFLPSESAGKEGMIYYQIIHERKTRRILTSYYVFPNEWNRKERIAKVDKAKPRRSYIYAIRDRIKWDLDRFARITRKLDNEKTEYTCIDIVTEFERHAMEYSLFNYMENLIVQFKRNGKIRTSETYRAALNSFKKYNDHEDIMLDNITSETMEAYEGWMQQHDLTPNTISFYMRILRAAYNRAVYENVIEDRTPFRHVYTGIDKTEKRAIRISAIKRIYSLNLCLEPALDLARDMFLMSFFFRGMSFVDMAFLRKSDLKDGYLSYRRRKTGQLLHIKWTREMQNIIEKYPENDSAYLLPVIRRQGINERCAYRNMSYCINRDLKKIARMANIKIPLTMYVARHSWASIAKIKGILVNVISEGMGHDSETTTKIYLASLDTSIVDRANTIVMKSLK